MRLQDVGHGEHLDLSLCREQTEGEGHDSGIFLGSSARPASSIVTLSKSERYADLKRFPGRAQPHVTFLQASMHSWQDSAHALQAAWCSACFLHSF